MDELILNSGPALAFVKDLSTWFIVNNRGDPITWLADSGELAWFFTCVIDLGVKHRKKLVVKNTSTEVPGQNTQAQNAAA